MLLVFLGLLSSSAAMPFQMPMPRMPGFSSKSEEMMRYGQFNFMNAPPMMPMGPYGHGMQMPPPPYPPPPYPPPPYPQMPMWPQPPPNGWQPPPVPNHPSKTDQTQETQKPNQTQPDQPQGQRQPVKEPPSEPAKAKEEGPQPQAFPPFGNGLFPYPQPPWPIPQRGPPPAFVRPQFSNEEGGNPYYPYYGYHGFGGRPYYSEEMEDYEKPKEKDPPKVESPSPESTVNSTVTEANSTQANSGGNDTSTIGNRAAGPSPSDPPVQHGVFPAPTVNISGQGVPRTQTPWRAHQPNIYENNPNPNARNGPSGRPWHATGAGSGNRQYGPSSRNPQIQRGPRWNSVPGEGKQAARPGNPTYHKAFPPTSRANYPNYAGNPANFRRKLQGPNKPFMGTNTPSNKPFMGTNVASNKPFMGTNSPSNKPFMGTNIASNKPFMGTNSPSNKPFVGTNVASNKPFMGTNIASNKHFMGTNVAPRGPKQGTVNHSVKIQNPNEKLPGPKERTVGPTKDPTVPWRSSQQYGVNKQNYKLPRQQLGLHFISAGQRENFYHPRGGSRAMPSSSVQTQGQNLPKGIALEPRRIFEAATKQPELKHNTHQPATPQEIPSTREHGPAQRNTWNHYDILPPFKENPMRQEENLDHPTYVSRGSVFYHGHSPYYPRGNSPLVKSKPWDERVDSPNTMGQPENSQYLTSTPDQKETIHYNEEDPVDPTGDEAFPRRSGWGEQELSFKGSQTTKHYEGEQYVTSQPKEYLPYSLGKPSKPREDFPYTEFYPWSPEETFPSYNPSPTISPPVESSYYVNNAIGQEESTLYPSWNSWDHRNPAQGQKESVPYFTRNFWDQPTNVYKSNPLDRKQNPSYSRDPPAGLQRSPTWREEENWNYGVQIPRLNSPEREHLAFPDLITQSYPVGQTGAHLFHQSQRGSCCIGGFAAHRDNPLALQDFTPPYSLPPGEKQDTSPMYEGSHTKYTRPRVSTTSILSSQRNSSENKLTAESPNPSAFRDDVPALRRNAPCSVKNQAETGILAFPGASSPRLNTPCLKGDIRGDALEPIFEGRQIGGSTAGLTPERLITGTPRESRKSEGTQSEVKGGEGRQPQRPPTILQLPCFSSKLAELHSPSTGPPPSNGRQSLSDGELSAPTANPNTLVRLATGEQLKSVSVDQPNADGRTPFESFQGTSPEDQGQDCLLLQA